VRIPRHARIPGPARTAWLGVGALLAGLLLGAGCVEPRADAVETRFPALRDVPEHRLADAHPFVLPAASRVTLFFCRWPADTPIPVSLPLDASAEERTAIERALRAWEGAGLGIRFLPIDGGSAPIEIRFEDEALAIGRGGDMGNAVVDCLLAPLSQQTDPGVVRDARLARARLRIARQTAPSWQGKARPLTAAELTGTVLHELGHALGFQGHARRGDTVMVREVEKIPRLGAALLAGERFADPTLRALYRVPSVAVLSSTPVDSWRTDLVDRMARLAEQEHLEGPYARVGESAARIFWRDHRGAEYGLVVIRVAEAIRRPATTRVVPEARTRRALPRENDAKPDQSGRE
jgi:hypothetical protein